MCSVPEHPLGSGDDLDELHVSILRIRRVNSCSTPDFR